MQQNHQKHQKHKDATKQKHKNANKRISDFFLLLDVFYAHKYAFFILVRLCLFLCLIKM